MLMVSPESAQNEISIEWSGYGRIWAIFDVINKDVKLNIPRVGGEIILLSTGFVIPCSTFFNADLSLDTLKKINDSLFSDMKRLKSYIGKMQDSANKYIDFYVRNSSYMGYLDKMAQVYNDFRVKLKETIDDIEFNGESYGDITSLKKNEDNKSLKARLLFTEDLLQKEMNKNDAHMIDTPNDNLIEKIISEFKMYNTDLIKMMELPALANFNDKQVANFNAECVLWEHNQSTWVTKDFVIEWERLKNHAHTIQKSFLNSNQRKKLSEASVMLDKALNEESTENEVRVSVRGLKSTLEGVLPWNHNTESWLKTQTGLKELTS